MTDRSVRTKGDLPRCTILSVQPAHESWPTPSPAVRELIRTAAEALLAVPEEGYDAIDAVTLADLDPAILGDPALVAAIRRTNRANLTHWLRVNVQRPGERVPPAPPSETFGVARDLVRRGLDQTAVDAYRTGQNAAWRLWMAQAFALTSDPAELGELLDVTARSIFDFVDRTLLGIAEEMQRERAHLTRGTQAERLEVTTLVLGGAPIAADRASRRLGYELGRTHTAAVVFTDAPEPDQGELDAGAELLARASGARRPLTVLASSAALWTWTAGQDGPDLDALRAGLAGLPTVRVALGPTLPGVDGFRRSHQDALATQRLMQRVPDVRLTTFDEVQVVALATHDEQAADELVRRTLGPLADAPAELRDTLRAYLREDCNATRAAQVLYAHRNTVLNRLARAQELLPAPLAGRGLQVGLALEIVHWLGPR
ncbi:transcriptional regulator [Paraconexibacter algicola]|uniref:Transcriptional regulator n=1 Tax=Paraconexibacter algicola TaxID=2133960 RepID=A0A2T4UDP8_9ACTN|nr:transcriptional regulator [Paraconexibacter algicola]